MLYLHAEGLRKALDRGDVGELQINARVRKAGRLFAALAPSAGDTLLDLLDRCPASLRYEAAELLVAIEFVTGYRTPPRIEHLVVSPAGFCLLVPTMVAKARGAR